VNEGKGKSEQWTGQKGNQVRPLKAISKGEGGLQLTGEGKHWGRPITTVSRTLKQGGKKRWDKGRPKEGAAKRHIQAGWNNPQIPRSLEPVLKRWGKGSLCDRLGRDPRTIDVAKGEKTSWTKMHFNKTTGKMQRNQRWA